MRISDREVTNIKDILDIIKQCDVCRIAINDEVVPYIVPMNFGVDVVDDEIYFYFHCASVGKKLDLIRKNPYVSFEMDCEHNLVLYENTMSCTFGYASVMGYGLMEFVEENKVDALKIIMRQYHEEEFAFGLELLPVTTVLCLKVMEITGKRRNNKR